MAGRVNSRGAQMHNSILENLGPPNLKLEGLQLWIHGRQFPNSQDYWDGNWLNVTAHCGGQGASVIATGAIVHLSELESWHSKIKSFRENLSCEANLECMEPNLSVSLKPASLGHIDMHVSITPDHLTQHHRFEFSIDQSYLTGLARQASRYWNNIL
jgi:hypothetical protein